MGAGRTVRSEASLRLGSSVTERRSLHLGLPIVRFDKYLPERALQLAETAIALVIVYLAVRLLVHWRRGLFHARAHEHDGSSHLHLHSHAETRARAPASDALAAR